MASKDVATLKPITAPGGLDNYTSIQADTMEKRQTVYRAIQNAGSLKDHVNVPMKVTDVIVREAHDIVDDPKEGTVRDGHITTFILEDGSAVGTNSATAKTALDTIMGVFGQPHVDWDVLTIVPKMQNSGNGRSFITLDVVI